MLHHKAESGALVGSGLVAGANSKMGTSPHNIYNVKNYRRPGASEECITSCGCEGCVNLTKQTTWVLSFLKWPSLPKGMAFLDNTLMALWQGAWFVLPSTLRELKTYCANYQLNFEFATENLTTTAGKNDQLTQYFKGSSYTAAWFVGLVDNSGFSAYAAADTSASHSGWTESTAYTQSTRPTWTGGTVASGSVDNSASVAAFSINATVTIRGAFQISNSTKGGTTGILYGEADFASSRSLLNGDTLNVTVTDTLT